MENSASPLTPEEELFRKGFNDGYILEKHSPKMFKEIMADQKDSKLPFIEGMKAGGREYKRQQVIAIASGKGVNRKQDRER